MMDNEWFVFFIALLAVWRVSHLIQAEDGPFSIIAGLRKAAGNSVWGKLMDCFYCLSMWIAFPIAWLCGTGWFHIVLLWLALSGGAILLNEWRSSIKKKDIFFKEDD
jgi:hypothetical protein